MFSKKGAVVIGNCFHAKYITLVAIFFLLSGCIAKNEVEVTLKNPNKTPATGALNVTVSNVQVVNHQIIITGTNLNAVSNFNIKESGSTTNLQIESQSSTSIVANTISNVTFAAGKVFDFIFSNANAASSFTVNFSLCDSTMGGKGFNCSITPNDKEVLSYDAVSGKWKPRAVNGLSYQGAWDASTALPSSTMAGDYFIVSVASGAYSVGDWIVFNGTTFDRINNSTVIANVFGRTGAITATKGDYILTKMGDVDLTTSPPIMGDVLKYNGTNWVPGTVSAGGGGTVTTVSGTAPITVATGTSTPVVSISQATGAANGYLSSADWNTFNNKQAAITAGTTAQYYQGDKTFQTLDTSSVPENTNLYFTNARALGVPLAGFDNTLTGQIAATDTILQAFGRAQNQINSLSSGGANYLIKNGPDTLSGAVSLTSVITATVTGDIIVNSTPLGMTSAVNKAYADGKLDKTTGGTVSGVVTLDSDLKIKGGTPNYVTIKGHATSAAYNFILPSSAGTSGYVLQTDGAGNLSWINPSSVTTGTGTVTSASIVDGTIMDVDISATAAIAQSKIVNLTTDLAAKQSTSLADGNILVGSAGNVATAVAMSGDATLANTGAITLKNTGTAGTYTSVTTDAQGRVTAGSNPSIVATVLTGLSTATNSVIAATDSILSAFGKLQAQISAQVTSIGNKADTTNISQTITALSVTGLQAPVAGSDAATKTYVDTGFVANAGGAAAVQIGTLAARPAAAAGNTGRMYVANDAGNEAVYVSSGAAWIKIASNALSGTVGIANGGTNSTAFTANTVVVANPGATALVSGPALDDTTAVAATIVKRGPAGEVYGQYITPTTTVTENAACTAAIGTIAKDSLGNILTCQ
ncbi:MAG: beta strand repeat-containing protein [Bacteriovorax sp.]